MATRVTPEQVAAIIETDERITLRPFIQTAHVLTNWLQSCDSDGLLDCDTLIEIEKWLAAHFYAHRDQVYQQKGEGKASATFQGQTAMVLSSTQYGQTALLLDVTGCLAQRSDEAANAGKFRVKMHWLGVKRR